MSADAAPEPVAAAKGWGVLRALLVLCVGGGAAIGIAFAGETQRHGGGALELPAWAPPASLLGPVWPVLHALMAIGAWLVWRAPAGRARRRALGAFAAQLVRNGAIALG